MAKNYLFTSKQGFKSTIENTLSAFSQPISETFLMMENDLKGFYKKNERIGSYPELPYIREGKLHYKNQVYDKILLTPLLMDFSQKQEELDKVYYSFEALDKITPYALDTIKAIKTYYDANPDGLFEFYPFLGVNPPVHSLDEIKVLFERFINTSHFYHKDKTVEGDKAFYGIKLYPPLGTDPWPEDRDELEKMKYVYEFATKYDIPIISHCDDQGFRGVPAKEAWHYTDPHTWRTVLENYPTLRIDFAHVGYQYTPGSNSGTVLDTILKKQVTWFDTIMQLMCEFDNVYSDISFTGAQDGYFKNFDKYLSSLPLEKRERIKSRMMFGTDFSINLLKVESYSSYFRTVETELQDEELLDSMVSANPINFLKLREPLAKKSLFKR